MGLLGDRELSSGRIDKVLRTMRDRDDEIGATSAMTARD